MTIGTLIDQIKLKKTFLCVGLDSDIDKIPAFLLEEPDAVFEFNRQIIDATADYCVAFKINTAFYESQGSRGWVSLEQTIEYLNRYYPDHFTIADAKRGDIGNTSSQYAKAFFETMNFDSITVAPYMGKDSIEPFLSFENKVTILLGLTSNVGSQDFEELMIDGQQKALYEKVIETALTWKNAANLMFVVGATKSENLLRIRDITPDHFLLIPGIGAQGGSLEEVCKNGFNSDCGLLVNSSRNIIFASDKEDFANVAADEAKKIKIEMEQYLEKYL